MPGEGIPGAVFSEQSPKTGPRSRPAGIGGWIQAISSASLRISQTQECGIRRRGRRSCRAGFDGRPGGSFGHLG